MGERIGGTGKHVGDGKINSCGDFVKWLRVLASNARQRHQSQTLSAKFARSRVYVRALFDWVPFQVVVGVILVVNFGLEIFKNQRQEMLVDDNGDPTPLSAKLDIVDTSFLVIFTTELFLNVYARWMRDFLSDGWCCFDALVIAMSLITPFLPVSEDTRFPVQIFRLFRALRILRLFGRLKSVRVIINALSASLSPVANAFFIMFVVLMIYAILGVSLFAEKAPGTFGKFDRSVSTLFRIAGGDTWVDGMDVLDAESGTVNWAVGVYVFSFILIVNWTLLQVSVAVLLDNFVSETSREKDAANALIVEEKRIQYSIGNVLDPLLKMIAVEYIDHASLTSSLAEIFHFLLTSVGAQDELTCDDMIKGISNIDLGDDQQGDDSRSVHTTRIHMTKMDYDTITQQGDLAKDNGALGAAEFDMVMRKQVHNYIQRKLQQSTHETETLQDFALIASLKALVMDVDAMKEQEMEMQRELSEQISASLSDLHHFIALLLTGDGDEEKIRFLLKTTLPFRPAGNTYFETPRTARCSCCSRLARPIEPTPTQSPRSILVPTPRTHSIFTHSTLKSPRALDSLVCRSTTETVPTRSRTSSSSSQCLTLNV
jgi:voltage-gated sodium channel